MADSSDSISVDMETIYLGGKFVDCTHCGLHASDIDDPHTFVDLFVSSSDPILLMRACAYYPNYGLGAFGIVPKFKKLELRHTLCYGLGTGSPLSPSFNFGLELAQNLQFIVSFYQHVVVQRRVKNPLEDNEVVGITNYIDFGFELQTRIDDENTSNDIHDSTFRVAASWQANKNILTKAGPLGSSFCLAFKSWWKPSFTFSMSGYYFYFF
ncbi:hypothetical protein HanPI659440_Chr16g0643501 [Helianthus annuus]|nr:hypothetical protein HanPI659440_Chr16g0643501 [Helianthus annuus]